MWMTSRSTVSESLTSKQSFVLGERSLRAYLAGGGVRFLEDAEASFSALRPEDRAFDYARFYLGVAKTQLRKTSESIKIFEELRNRTTYLNDGLKTQIPLQLAYAQIKTYTSEGFKAAEEELRRVEESAVNAKDEELLLQTKAIKVFLYSVLSVYGEDVDLMPTNAENAVKLGEELLDTVPTTADSGRALRFEALNALGIAWMRIGEKQWNGFADRATSWGNAQRFYDQALQIIPNSLRVLQNLARLRLLQVDLDPTRDKEVLLEQAKEYCERSLEVSDQDQYPFYLLAQIATKQSDARAAWENIHIGRAKPGAVKEKEWVEVEDAARRTEQAKGATGANMS
jgi:tetratricopeptide (TPR) repeat protein